VAVGDTENQIIILGTLSDSSAIRLSLHGFMAGSHSYYDFMLSGGSQSKGLYYNSSLGEVHCLLRDASSYELYWYILGGNLQLFKLSGIPSTESISRSTY